MCKKEIHRYHLIKLVTRYLVSERNYRIFIRARNKNLDLIRLAYEPLESVICFPFLVLVPLHFFGFYLHGPIGSMARAKGASKQVGRGEGPLKGPTGSQTLTLFRNHSTLIHIRILSVCL